jgi:hypothetical protein
LLDPSTINEFVNALQRLFKIGIYYPSGHDILDKATERFMSLLVRVAGDNSQVTLQDHEDSLKLEDIVVDKNLPFVKEFKELLSTLGITALVIDRSITMEELHQFVRQMLQVRSKVLTTKQFTQVEVDDLPDSIQAVSKEYLARKDASMAAEKIETDTSHNLESFVASLSRYGLNRDEIAKCKALLESLPDKLSKKKLDESTLPFATWDDVARLLARSVKAGDSLADPRERVSAYSDIHALSSILGELEKDTRDSKARDSINFLVSIIKKPVQDEEGTKPDAKPKKPHFPEEPDVSIERIQEFSTRNKPHPRILAQLPDVPADNETLTILLLMANHEQPLQNQVQMQKYLRDILSGPLQDKSWQILSGGLYNIVLSSKYGLVALATRFLIEPLRRSNYSSPLKLLSMTTGLCNSKEQFLLLWPAIVNEILVSGSSSEPEAFASLCEFASRISEGEMLAQLPKLQELGAFQDGTIASDIFAGVTRKGYPLFGFLLKTQVGPPVAERVIGGLRRNPADWLIKAVIHLLDFSVQEHKLYLYTYLQQAGKDKLSAELLKKSAAIIAELLPKLPQDKRSELWVVDTIAAMADLRTPATQALLEQIARERKMLFIPEWPTECRTAADGALRRR